MIYLGEFGLENKPMLKLVGSGHAFGCARVGTDGEHLKYFIIIYRNFSEPKRTRDELTVELVVGSKRTFDHVWARGGRQQQRALTGTTNCIVVCIVVYTITITTLQLLSIYEVFNGS